MTYRIYFRPIEPEDKNTIKDLHESCFPVRYTDEFYDDICRKNLGDKSALYTCVACAIPSEDVESHHHERDDTRVKDAWDQLWKSHEATGQYDDSIFFRSIVPLREDYTPSTDFTQGHERIAGCLIGKFIHNPSEENKALLLTDPDRYSSLFYIMTLGISNEFRQCGLATALVERCYRLARHVPSCAAVYLHVITYNTAAIRFYEKLGFRRVKEVQGTLLPKAGMCHFLDGILHNISSDYYSIDGNLYDCYLYALYTHDQTSSRFRSLLRICKVFFSVVDKVGRGITLSILNNIFSSKKKSSLP